MAISSSSPAVAARCLHLRVDVGAAASQSITDPRLGGRLLDLLSAGCSATEAMAAVVADEPTVSYRQLAVVDRAGQVAAHSGEHTLGLHHTAAEGGAVAVGNLLAAPGVVDAMLAGYLRSRHKEFAGRLVAGLEAALAAGGETTPVRSAGLTVQGPGAGWAETDLRVDWHPEPVSELRSLWRMWRPQVAGYLARGLTPGSAPAFGTK
jgi:uncharacterized Ntn-hydrolase superfamily protein